MTAGALLVLLFGGSENCWGVRLHFWGCSAKSRDDRWERSPSRARPGESARRAGRKFAGPGAPRAGGRRRPCGAGAGGPHGVGDPRRGVRFLPSVPGECWGSGEPVALPRRNNRRRGFQKNLGISKIGPGREPAAPELECQSGTKGRKCLRGEGRARRSAACAPRSRGPREPGPARRAGPPPARENPLSVPLRGPASPICVGI